jgi:hypothetical protein
MVIILLNKWYPSRSKILIWFSVLVFFVFTSMPFIVVFVRNEFNYLYIGLDAFFKSIKQFSISDIERIIMLNRTMEIRYRQLLFAIDHQDTIPVVGIGIGKAVLMPESFYTMYYYRVGLIGIGIHFGLIFYSIYWSLFFAKKYAKIKGDKRVILFTIFTSISIYFVSFFFNYLSSAINDQTRTGFIFYTLIAILVYYKNHYRYSIISPG